MDESVIWDTPTPAAAHRFAEALKKAGLNHNTSGEKGEKMGELPEDKQSSLPSQQLQSDTGALKRPQPDAKSARLTDPQLEPIDERKGTPPNPSSSPSPSLPHLYFGEFPILKCKILEGRGFFHLERKIAAMSRQIHEEKLRHEVKMKELSQATKELEKQLVTTKKMSWSGTLDIVSKWLDQSPLDVLMKYPLLAQQWQKNLRAIETTVEVQSSSLALVEEENSTVKHKQLQKFITYRWGTEVVRAQQQDGIFCLLNATLPKADPESVAVGENKEGNLDIAALVDDGCFELDILEQRLLGQ